MNVPSPPTTLSRFSARTSPTISGWARETAITLDLAGTLVVASVFPSDETANERGKLRGKVRDSSAVIAS